MLSKKYIIVMIAVLICSYLGSLGLRNENLVKASFRDEIFRRAKDGLTEIGLISQASIEAAEGDMSKCFGGYTLGIVKRVALISKNEAQFRGYIDTINGIFGKIPASGYADNFGKIMAVRLFLRIMEIVGDKAGLDGIEKLFDLAKKMTELNILSITDYQELFSDLGDNLEERDRARAISGKTIDVEVLDGALNIAHAALDLKREFKFSMFHSIKIANRLLEIAEGDKGQLDKYVKRIIELLGTRLSCYVTGVIGPARAYFNEQVPLVVEDFVKLMEIAKKEALLDKTFELMEKINLELDIVKDLTYDRVQYLDIYKKTFDVLRRALFRNDNVSLLDDAIAQMKRGVWPFNSVFGIASRLSPP